MISDEIARKSGSLLGSVIIVNYNGGEKLIRCIDTVLSSLSPHTELVLVDNGSTDGSADEAKARFPEAILVRSAENRGFGAGGNLGVTRARGRFVAFLNPDTTVDPGWLTALFERLNDNRIGLVTSKILQAMQPERINTCGNDVHISGLALTRGLGRPRESFSTPREIGAVSGAAFAIRRDLFEELGGFDEDFFLYVEDTDLSWRARLLGKRCLFEPKSVVFHDYGFRLTPLKIFHQERNRYLMLLKCLRWPTLLVLLPALLLAEVVTWGFVVLHDRANAGNKVRAYGWILSNWRRVMAKRKDVQSRRRAADRSLLRTTGYRLEFEQVSRPAIARAARLFFGPLFFLFRGVAFSMVWW